jgi:hypothetical protein
MDEEAGLIMHTAIVTKGSQGGNFVQKASSAMNPAGCPSVQVLEPNLAMSASMLGR